MPVFVNDEQREHSIDCVLLGSQGESILLLLGCENQELSVLLADDKKIRTRISEDFLGPKFMTPKFWGRQKFLLPGAYF